MKNIYETFDFYLGAFLMSKGIPLLNATRFETGKTRFEFENSPQVAELIGGYFSDSILVSPARFGNAIRHLRKVIYGEVQINGKTNNYGKEQ